MPDKIVKAQPQDNKCPICGSFSVYVFIELPGVPVNCNVLAKSKEDALAAERGDVRLGFCTSCGHIFNTLYDPAKIVYTKDYENSLHYSPLFQEYARKLALSLMERHSLYGKDIIEIGCGKGDFLMLLSELGGNRGIGFDTSYDYKALKYTDNERMVFIQDFYSEKYAGFKSDMIICRHVLEHIANPRGFISTLRNCIGKTDTAVFFEVPNAFSILKDFGIWDIVYEHYSYYTSNSLLNLFNACGFSVLDAKESFGGQYICIEAVPADVAEPHGRVEDPSAPARLVASFQKNFTNKFAFWKSKLKSLERQNKKTVIWGGGSKGAMFLNMLNVNENQARYVVDMNPRKFGRFIPGTGQEIVKPEFLLYYRPQAIVVMNPIYAAEIGQMVKDYRLDAKVLTA